MVIQKPQTSFEGQVFLIRLHEKQQSRNKNRLLTKNILFHLGHLIIHTADSKTTPQKGLTPRSNTLESFVVVCLLWIFLKARVVTGMKKSDLQNHKAWNWVFESDMQVYVLRTMTSTRACASQSCHFQTQQTSTAAILGLLCTDSWVLDLAQKSRCVGHIRWWRCIN